MSTEAQESANELSDLVNTNVSYKVSDSGPEKLVASKKNGIIKHKGSERAYALISYALWPFSFPMYSHFSENALNFDYSITGALEQEAFNLLIGIGGILLFAAPVVTTLIYGLSGGLISDVKSAGTKIKSFYNRGKINNFSLEETFSTDKYVIPIHLSNPIHQV